MVIIFFLTSVAMIVMIDIVQSRRRLRVADGDPVEQRSSSVHHESPYRIHSSNDEQVSNHPTEMVTIVPRLIIPQTSGGKDVEC
jgi:hypothetical protein